MNRKPEHNGHAPFQEAFSNGNEDPQTKEELIQRLQQVSQMKIEAREEISRLQAMLESTIRTAESLEAEEEAIKRSLQRLE